LPVGKGPFPLGDGNFTALFSTPMTALLHPQDILLFSLVIGRVSGNQPVREFELSVPTA
jgi:hypothetical protein